MQHQIPLNAAPDYRAAREALLAAEVALRDQIEAVAQMRRALPVGAAVQNYVFHGSDGDVALADLFEPGKPSLMVIHFMFTAADTKPCSMCAMWTDGYDAIARHVGNRVPVALVARTPIGKLRDFAHGRGWKNLRLLSSADNSFNPDFRMETADGRQMPGVSIFSRDAEGTVHHRYTQCADLGPNQWRGIDLLTPVWNLFDLLPEGRGDWMPKHAYMPPNG